jgi:O-acetylhomoserine/O-acetylserine sulfhydrylase
VDSGKFDWGASPEKFPQFHGGREGTADANLYKVFGTEAYAALLKADTLRDIGSTLSSQAAHELLVGLETLSLRAERQASNAMQLAQWLEKHPQVSWVQYLGLENHHSHQLALKYLIRGFGTVLAFGVKGGQDAGLKLADSLELIGHTAK